MLWLHSFWFCLNCGHWRADHSGISRSYVKKKALRSTNAGDLAKSKYGIDCEIGQIDSIAYKLKNGKKTTYDTGSDFFEATASRERFKSNCLEELMLRFASIASTRDSTELINRIRHEDKGTITTTYRNFVESEGTNIQASIEEKCTDTLRANGFKECDGMYMPPCDFAPEAAKHTPQPIIEDASIATGLFSYNACDYEFDAVNVTIDDIGVRRQTEMRPRDESMEQPKRVQTTVAHIQHGEKSYTLNSRSVVSCLRLVLGLLLINGLARKQIVIFADGAKSINNAIQKMLPFLNFKIILDWYHLEKKFYEQLGMALKGSKVKNEFMKEKLMPCLWFGNVSGAIKALQNIDARLVRNRDVIIYLIGYLERLRRHIPCYAMRKHMGLRNSSGIGEKCNDLAVAKRQKHNGMSWSNSGSLAFASVATTTLNAQLHNWIHNRDISLDLHAAV